MLMVDLAWVTDMARAMSVGGLGAVKNKTGDAAENLRTPRTRRS